MTTKSSQQNLIFIVIAIACVFSWYFYRPQIINFWNSAVQNSQELSVNSWNWLEGGFNKIFAKNSTGIKNCGITAMPDFKNPSTYENNAVLNCLGSSALRCENAEAVLKDALFPTIFKIVKNQETCDFKLSYGEDSNLVDINGKKLALQHIYCPLNIVKAVDETKSVPTFNTPSINNPSKYASQIYFYGILGLFMENNVSSERIHNLGCSGSYIDSVIASYRKMQSGQ